MDQLVGLIFIALPLLLIYMVFQRQRRQQRELVATQSALAPGSQVMTTSGLFGTVISIESGDETPAADHTVVLEVAPGIRTTWARQAIARIVEESAPAPEPGAPPPAT